MQFLVLGGVRASGDRRGRRRRNGPRGNFRKQTRRGRLDNCCRMADEWFSHFRMPKMIKHGLLWPFGMAGVRTRAEPGADKCFWRRSGQTARHWCVDKLFAGVVRTIWARALTCWSVVSAERATIAHALSCDRLLCTRYHLKRSPDAVGLICEMPAQVLIVSAQRRTVPFNGIVVAATWLQTMAA